MHFSQQLFDQMPLVGIMRGFDLKVVAEIVPRYLAAGLTTIEITSNTPGFSAILKEVSGQFGEQLNVGAGTICTKNDLETALNAGARFIVTPVLRESVIRECVAAGIPVFPGALTPSEIYQAWEWGADMVKVFPASAFGPSYIREILAPLDQLKLLPTGGVSLENMADYYRAGAKGFGLGSLLFDKEMIRLQDWPGLQQKMENAANCYRRIQLVK